MEIDRGIILVNTGNGKGKSTAAFGTAFRALGQGFTVAIIQFIKGKWKTGEMETFKLFDNLTHIISGEGFTWNSEDLQKDKDAAIKGWNIAKDIILGKADKDYQLIVLDELNIALDLKFVDIDDVLEVLKNKPDTLNIIITGRNAPKEIIEIADTVTNMTPIKHAYERGIKAQKGIEF
ncbi:MAG: cob(I)yrinic acid a,c-diamide adenosyltransferase [Spirochaetaceae bacterium]